MNEYQIEDSASAGPYSNALTTLADTDEIENTPLHPILQRCQHKQVTHSYHHDNLHSEHTYADNSRRRLTITFRWRGPRYC
jgi:hypothetical protein